MSRTVKDLIAQAAALPLRDAAYFIWRENSTFERLEPRTWPQADMSTPEVSEKSMQEFAAMRKREHDTAQDGPEFARLKCAHPRADDAEAKTGHCRGSEIRRRLFQVFFIRQRGRTTWIM